MLLAFALLMAAVHVAPEGTAQYLVPNDVGQPQHLEGLDASVCAGRSPQCNVLLDVPSDCVTNEEHPSTKCPVVFCFHGFGGHSTQMSNECSQSLHENSMIGLYPQGDAAGRRNGNLVRLLVQIITDVNKCTAVKSTILMQLYIIYIQYLSQLQWGE